MMKVSQLYALGLLAFTACGDKKEVQHKPPSPTGVQNPILNKRTLPENLEKWLQFYRPDNPDFSFDRFKLSDSATITYSSATIKGNFDENFNKVYEPFLVYSPDKSKYLDFDSYHWIPDENGNPGFEADQQVALVHLPSKAARQIAFFGPSFSIEEAYWEGDSTAVLLGNTYEKVPFFIRYNFNRNMKYTYRYADTLKFTKSYTEERLKQKGIGGK